MAISLENSAKIAALRERINAGEEVPLADLREGFAILRQDRKAAALTSAASKSAKAPVDTASILAGLKNTAKNLQSGPIEGA